MALPANRSSFSVMPFLLKAEEAVPCRLIIQAVAKKVPRMVMLLAVVVSDFGLQERVGAGDTGQFSNRSQS